MAINVYKRQGIQDKGEWYDLASNAISYVFPVLNLVDRALVHVKAYSKTATNTPIITGSFSNESGDPVGSAFTTVDTDTGSTANFSELIVAVPVGATRINLQTSIAAFAFVQPSQLAPFAPLNPTLFTTSQSITVGDSSPFTLMGGGAGGSGAGTGSYFFGGGGGSGYLTFGTVPAGTYTLTIGSGGGGGAGGGGGTGGTSSISTFNALGGNPGGVTTANSSGANGGSGGSGGGGGARNSPIGNGGTNGASGNAGERGNGGTGSGVTALRFTPGDGGGGGGGGGIYAGGGGGLIGGGGTSFNGGSANGVGGGGGGAGSNSQTVRTGGTGGTGALWIILG